MKRLVLWLALLCYDLIVLCRPTQGTDSSINAGTTEAMDPPCEIAGQKWSSGFKYLVGGPHQRSSVYAECSRGLATCYSQSDESDRRPDVIACDDSSLEQHRRRLGIYLPQQNLRWPKGVLCYDYKFEFDPREKGLIQDAMKEYEEKTAIRFVPTEKCKEKFGDSTEVCDNCQQVLHFVQNENACFASLGYEPTPVNRLVNLGKDCFNRNAQAPLHELGHSLGMIHEHMHPKREVIMLVDKLVVPPDNYVKDTTRAVTDYTRNSIMHYDRGTGMCIPKDPSLNYCDVVDAEPGCVKPTEDHCDPSQDKSFGQSEHLVEADVKTIAIMYGTTPAIDTANGNTKPTNTEPAKTDPPPKTDPPTTTTAPAPPTSTPSPPGPTPTATEWNIALLKHQVFSIKDDGNGHLILERIQPSK